MRSMRGLLILLSVLLHFLWPSFGQSTDRSTQTLEGWLWEAAWRLHGRIPYRYGGEDPRRGMDCSAFTRYLYAHLGLHLPRTSREQYQASTPTREYRPGYLLFFSQRGREIDHVGIYIGRGYMLHASGKWGWVVAEPVARYGRILVGIGIPPGLLPRK